MKLSLVILLTLLSYNISIAQKPIQWDSENLISWSNFKGEVAKKNIFSKAELFSGIHYEYLNDSLNTSVLIVALMSPQRSWTTTQDSITLVHERYHFKITEIGARRLRKAIKSRVFEREQDFDSLIYKMQQEIFEETKKQQNEYDSYTKHGLFLAYQIEYQTKIDKELEELEEYSNPVVTLNRW